MFAGIHHDGHYIFVNPMQMHKTGAHLYKLRILEGENDITILISVTILKLQTSSMVPM